MAGFEFAYRISGSAPTIQNLIVLNDTSFKKGDLVNLETGQVDLAATADTNLVGVVLATLSGLVPGTDRIAVITDPDAVYRVVDNNARSIGATLDLAGASGAQGVAASSNKEFVVEADSGADEPTLVRVNVGKHFKNKAQ
jgi:hypothetical protein